MLGRMVCTSFGIEDINGWTQLLSLYNIPGTLAATGSELDTLFPLNTVLAIREPMAKMALAGSHSHIRVDSPSDIVVLPPDDRILDGVKWSTGNRKHSVHTRTAIGWKAVGDGHFKSKEYWPAVVAYSRALQLDPTSTPLRLNRALARIRLGLPSASLRDLRSVLSSDTLSAADKLKASYRSAQAEYASGRYDIAKEFYEECLKLDQDSLEAKLGVEKCHDRLQEQKTGNYRWDELFDQTLRATNLLSLDVSDFIGPIKVAPVPNRGGGRGVLATRDIEVGELLVNINSYLI